MTKEYFANKDLVVDSKPIPRGELVMTIETDHPAAVQKFLDGVAIGSIVNEKPKPLQEKPAPAARPDGPVKIDSSAGKK